MRMAGSGLLAMCALAPAASAALEPRAIQEATEEVWRYMSSVGVEAGSAQAAEDFVRGLREILADVRVKFMAGRHAELGDWEAKLNDLWISACSENALPDQGDQVGVGLLAGQHGRRVARQAQQEEQQGRNGEQQDCQFQPALAQHAAHCRPDIPVGGNWEWWRKGDGYDAGLYCRKTIARLSAMPDRNCP